MDHLLSVLHPYGEAIFEGVIALCIGFIIFSVMERMYQLKPARKSWRANLLDLQFAVLSMLYAPFIYFILSAIFSYLALQISQTKPDPHISWGSMAGQLAFILVVRDCLIYLRHRIFHLRPVWAFHSIHHSSEEINWLSAARFHPAENLIETMGEVLLFYGCSTAGFNPMVLSAASLMIGFYNFFIHSNLRWTFGPLRHVLVSPVFHRWHHSDAPEAMDKNFAAMFSFLDLVFGTFYMPRDVMPETLGLSAAEKEVHPRTLAGQLWYPFRRKPR